MKNEKSKNSVSNSNSGRIVVVVDRGWIFAGDATRKNGRILLNRAVNVVSWRSIGFDGMIENPLRNSVTLKVLNNPVDIPETSEIFSIPVEKNWGLE